MNANDLTWKTPTSWGHFALSGSNGMLKYTKMCWTSNVVEHDLRDGKGRAIGNYAHIETHRALLGAANTTHTLDTTVRFYVCTHATRDGKSFGAIPRGTMCDSFEAAKALAAKKVAAVREEFVMRDVHDQWR